MSRRVRNWCDICRDLEPDIRCTNEGCPKKYHEACLRNVGLWQPGDEKRATYICPDCRESSTNESFCYICNKELILANDKRRKRKGRQLASSSPPQSEATIDKTADEGEETEPEEAAEEEDDDDDVDDGKEGDDESEQAEAEDEHEEGDEGDKESSEGGVATRQRGRQRALKQTRSKHEVCADETAADKSSGDDDTTQQERPRRSARQAAARNEESTNGKKGESSGAASGPGDDSGGGQKERRLKKVDVSNKDDFVLCDGCVRSAHLRCLGLSHMELNDDLWFCTECDPNSVAATAMAKSAAERKAAAMKHSSSNAATKTRLGNVDICYVCQKGGKLLGCDFCEQSFHPRCIDAEFLEFEKPPSATPDDPTSMVQGAEGAEGSALPALSSQEDVPVSMLEKWRCPICKGEDPLKNMGHKRMSRTAMLKLSREWQACIKQTHRQCRQNRDRFLWSCRKALIPFVTPRTLAKLRKSVGAPDVEPQKRRRGSRRAAGDESDETEGDGDTTRADEERQSLQAYNEAIKIAEEKNQTILKEGVVLKGYQTIGVGWLLNAFQHKAGAILADEMGLGKTIQCLAFLSSLKCMGITGPHLIVVPLSTVGNWAREIRRFIPHMRFVKICGSRFERDHIVADPTASQGLYDLYITTYETVVTEESFFCDSISWQCLILDEAHRIKNESGRIRHSLDRVSANMRTLLTGTPLQNNVKELFTLLNFLFPDILKDSGTFEQVFAKQEAVSQGGLTNEVVDESAVQAVSSLLSKMMLRRTKDLVVKLPRKLEHDVWLPLSPVSAFWYSKLLQVSETESAVQQLSVKKLLGTVVKMRICCCHPRGLVTRDTQLRKFKEVFQGLGPVEEHAVEKAANDLLSLAGEEHIRTSSKLLALDKLLCHLHVQNLEVSESYKRDFVQNCKDLYIQAHPLEPLTATAKHGISKAGSKASAVKASTKSEKIKQEADESQAGESQGPGGSTLGESNTGEPLEVDGPPLPGSADVTTKTDADQETVPNSQESSKAKPLTARQQAERTRRERLAAMAAQQAKLDAELEALESEVLHRITSSAQDPDLFREFMADAEVADVQATNLLKADEMGEGGGDDNDTVPESPTVPSPSPGEAPSPVVDLTNSATSFEEDAAHPVKTVNGSGSEKSHETAPHPDKEPMEEPDEAIPSKDLSNEASAKPLYPHKVLVFTQFQLVLDELEAYCKFRGFRYLRLDGSTNKMIRELDIREFNSLSSTHLVYLICTRAGGVGINLVTANHVILYDEDWNPFIDLQAIDRAHRIGQRRDVHVWKLITEWTVEERMAFRRRQKLKLDRLLIHANTANTGDVESMEEAEEIDGSGDRFSMDEIRKLLTHGRSAINKAYTANDQSLLTESLEEMIARPRKPLPVVEETEIEAEAALEEDLEMEEKSGEPRVSLAEALDPEERAECLVGTETQGAISRTSTDEPGDNDTELQDLEVEEKRSRRLRKRVPLVFQSLPQLEQKVKQERKLIHDKKCFKCGSGVNPSDEQADTLIACHRCPKVYHMSGCLNMEEVPRRTWTCPWHECCLCFRKGSQAGGLLIHCAECPTAFCFDCFPPEYRRYTPPATYYAELTRRGYPVNQDKLVLFLCSRCKALKEQQRRRALSRQQLDAELKKRREANLKAKLDAQRTVTSDKAATSEKKTADAKREFLARKRVIDDSEREWSREIRSNYERLFPEAFLEALRQKRQKQSEGKKEQIKDEITPVAGPSTEETPALSAVASSAPVAAVKSTAPTKVVLSKMPSEFCKVCENCRLPGHEAHACPFPLETEKRNISQTAPLPSATQEESTQQMEEEQVAEKIRHHSKRLIRSFCPKCGVSSRNHFRRHCEQLDASEVEEYAERKAKILKFVEELKAVPRIEIPPDMTISLATVESCRRLFQRQVDDIVANCLKSAGLEACVAQTASQTRQAQLGSKHPLQAAKSRRRRKSDDMEDLEGLSGVETDDPNYSPRKKARADGGGEEEPPDGNDVDTITQDDRKRRRPMPNFVELAGGGVAGTLNEEEEDRALKAVAARFPQEKWKDKRDGDRRKQARLEALDGDKEGEGHDRRYADIEVKRSSPTFTDTSARPHVPSISYGAGMSSLRPPGDPGLNGSRLPPSRWHGHPTQMLPNNRLPPQPIYGPPALWGPFGPRYPPGLIMPPVKWQWPAMAPLHGAYPPFGPPYGPPPGHMPK